MPKKILDLSLYKFSEICRVAESPVSAPHQLKSGSTTDTVLFAKFYRYQWRIQDFPEVGVPRYNFAKFPQKLHEIERIWTPGGIQNFTM